VSKRVVCPIDDSTVRFSVLAQGGNDSVNATFRNMSVDGGDGDDTLTTGSGAFGAGLDGGPGNDKLTGAPEGTLDGGDGNDTLTSGEAGRGRSFGGAGDDTLIGSASSDFLSGDAGYDTFASGGGNDQIDSYDGVGAVPEPIDCGSSARDVTRTRVGRQTYTVVLP
jgi:Ca2+-binding RTX toxin-like protein